MYCEVFWVPVGGACTQQYSTTSAGSQGILNVDDDVEEEFEIDINEAEPAFLKGQSSRSGVEVCGTLTSFSIVLQPA